jgi:tetratricopeptide (TPR) repeat protein
MFMTSFRRHKALFMVLAICLGMFAWQVPFAGAKAQAQKTATPPPQREEIPPDSNYMYLKDSAAIDQIKAKETDPQKRADALVAWVSGHPRATRAIAYAAAYYDEVVRGVLKAGDPQKALTMIQTFQTAAPSNTTLLPLQMSAYYQAKNWAKAAEIGEKLYAATPSAGLANDLSGIYMQAGNSERYLFYAGKVLADVGMEKGYAIALQIANVHVQKKEMAQALPLLAQLMTVYGDKVPPGIQEANWNQTRAFAFGMMAGDSYTKKDWPKAIELYEKVTKFAPKSEDAWYFIGMAKWQGKDQKGAIEPLAKAYVIGGKLYSQKAKDNLDQLWKAEHSGSMDGLDAVIAKAKADLGIG